MSPKVRSVGRSGRLAGHGRSVGLPAIIYCKDREVTLPSLHSEHFIIKISHHFVVFIVQNSYLRNYFGLRYENASKIRSLFLNLTCIHTSAHTN